MWTVLLLAAFAGDLVVNGVLVQPSALAGLTLTQVTLRVDAKGNMLITAPGFVVEPERRPAPAMPDSGVAGATWWLATEDSNSGGHVIDVTINGKQFVTLRSGEPQRIVDIGPWLVPGTNTIRVQSMSTAATGGSLYVYISSGSDRSGTVVMNSPRVQFGLGATRAGEYVREYTLDVTP